MKKQMIALLCAGVLFCAGCSASGRESSAPPESAPVSLDRFSVVRRSGAIADEYFFCYQNDDGTVSDVIPLGFQFQQPQIDGGRIYYTDGRLISVDLQGKDQRVFSDGGVSFDSIDFFSGGWIYCTGRGTGDPYQAVHTRVRTDFSTFERVDGPGEESSLPPSP